MPRRRPRPDLPARKADSPIVFEIGGPEDRPLVADGPGSSSALHEGEGVRDARFVDEVTLIAESGAGGDGLVAWRREKHVRLGGPAGGDGGNGGSVVFVADEGLSTLLDLKHRRHLKAPRGRNGGIANRFGARGADIEVRVPVGTMIADRDTGEPLADLTAHGARWVAVQGGQGGRGNTSFTSSTMRSPDFAEPGTDGALRALRLTLKLLADVGIVGLPNSGKSTLISRISNARPKIADYPFTTLVPNLGVVRYHEQTFVVADIPGLIEGASEGAGLGIRFLRHVERTALFLFLLDAGPERPSPLEALQLLERELERYDASLATRQRLVVLNKIDLPEVCEQEAPLAAELARRGIPLLRISAVTGAGIPELLATVAHRLQERPAAQ